MQLLFNKDIILRPELYSPPHFRIQGGGPPSVTQEDGRKFFCLILNGYHSLFVHVALHSVHRVQATTVHSWSGQVVLN